MQDRYAGDVGDFGKLGLLRELARHHLLIGINWYRIETLSTENNNDGKHISYVLKDTYCFKCCDEVLFNAMKSVIANRSVISIETANLISNAKYFNEVLTLPGRKIWFEKSMKKLSGSDIVFLDPDNGLKVKSITKNSAKSIKYVFEEEVAAYLSADMSVVFYNHRCREKENKYLERFHVLKENEAFKDIEFLGLKFVKGSIRDYIFLVKPQHSENTKKAINNILNSKWNQFFQRIEL